MKRDLAYFRALPYTRRARLCEENGEFFWHAWIEELPGCEVDSASKAASFADLAEVFEDYIAAKLEWGSEVPLPTRWPNLNTTDHPEAPASAVEQMRIEETTRAPSGASNQLESRETLPESTMVAA
jgi:hypothetical protein